MVRVYVTPMNMNNHHALQKCGLRKLSGCSSSPSMATHTRTAAYHPPRTCLLVRVSTACIHQ